MKSFCFFFQKEALFFFEKKNQKTFIRLIFCRAGRRRYGRCMRKLVVLLPLLLAACADPGARCGFAGQGTLPIAPLGSFAAVPATVNAEPVRLVVDTGAGHTVLSSDAARRGGVAPDLQHTIRATGIGGTATYATGRIDSLRLGDIPVEPAVVTVMESVPLADGNLGMDILGDVDLDIDLPAGRIALHRGLLCPGAAPPWGVPATELRTVAVLPRALPATARPRLLLVGIELDGQPALALLDTGAGRSVVARAFAARLGVDAAALAASPPLALAGLSPESGQGRIWRFREVGIAGRRFAAPSMLVADLHDAGFDVLLGMDYLRRHRVWLSYRARRVFVADAP